MDFSECVKVSLATGITKAWSIEEVVPDTDMADLADYEAGSSVQEATTNTEI